MELYIRIIINVININDNSKDFNSISATSIQDDKKIITIYSDINNVL